MTPAPTLCSYADAKTLESDLLHVDHFTKGWTLHGAINLEACPMCSSRLRRVACTSDDIVDDLHSSGVGSVEVRIEYCDQCGFWFAIEDWYDPDSPEYRVHCRAGIVRRYSLDDKDIPLAELRRFLSKNPEHVAHVDPMAFERLMADCLRSEYSHCEVVHMGRSGDRGIDVKLVTSDADVFLVQVKRRLHLNRMESFQVVRELNGVLFRDGFTKGMVITTAQGFTRAAHQELLVKTPLAQPYHVDLRAFDDVCRMLRLEVEQPYEPWRRFVKISPKYEEQYRQALAGASYREPRETD